MQKLVQIVFAFLILMSPAIAQETSGSLVITSNVQGATVWLDNREVGSTPFARDLSPGTYSIRVAARNYDPYVSRVRIQKDRRTTEEVELFEGGGTVEFIVSPPGADVFIDGQNAGKAPIRLQDLPPGEHRYVVSAAVHEGAAGSFRFQPGDNLLIVESLEASAGKWEVRSTPAGADVYIDDELVGQTPLSTSGIESGLHRVRVSKEGFGSVLREVDTSNGSKGELTVNLPRGGSEIRVQSRQDDARVLLNGNLMGTGKRVNFSLQRGVYQLRIEADGFQSTEARLSAPRRGSLIYKANLAKEGAQARSTVKVAKPLTSSWVFWGAIGGVTAGAGVATAVIVIGNQPDPPPDGDIKVNLP